MITLQRQSGDDQFTYTGKDTYKGTLGNPQSQNLYTYVQNNPLKWIDPSGHIIESFSNDGGNSKNSFGLPSYGPSVSSLIDAARIAGANSNTYWKNRSDLGTVRKWLAWASMSRNQFFYLYSLATQTVCSDESHCRDATNQEKANYFTNGNAEWAKQELIYHLDEDEISARIDTTEMVMNMYGGGVSKTEQSVIDKLDKYLLNPDHPIGGSKANWFQKALGFSRDNLDDLAKQIVFDPAKAVETGITEYGTKFNQVISIIGANEKVIDITFAWIKNTDGVIRLVTGIPSGK
ncbi:DUF6883 domain-containing protein [Paenibacillus ferrarius]|uniref:DUF6883 domain-containing protein n=1 Tax=Paenibacillus ferrarius TaxID=1469647 RepID=UPI003D274509